VAGPLYVMVTLALALTRDGFDFSQHRFSWLTIGDLGWMHQLNMVLVGLLTVLLAVGVKRVLREGRGAVWVPRLLVLFGLAYIVGGLLTADAHAGFPPGTTAAMAQTTLQGSLQNASRSASTLLLVAVCFVLATRLAADGRRGWAWLCGASFLLVLASLTAIGFVALGNLGSAFALAILATPWVLVTALAVQLYRGEVHGRDALPAREGTRSSPVAG
jgi:hypothetical protein